MSHTSDWGLESQCQEFMQSESFFFPALSEGVVYEGAGGGAQKKRAGQGSFFHIPSLRSRKEDVACSHCGKVFSLEKTLFFLLPKNKQVFFCSQQ